jgi:GNAT superfamily N-acetyltransferase
MAVGGGCDQRERVRGREEGSSVPVTADLRSVRATGTRGAWRPAAAEEATMNGPIVTRELVFRIEAAEAAYHEAKLRALGADDGNSRGVEIARLGGCVLLSIHSGRHNPSYNRAMCSAKEDEAHLDEIVRWLRDRAERFWFDVAPALVDGAVLGKLDDGGLCPSFLLNVVYTVPQEMGDLAPAGVVVKQLRLEERAHDFAVVLVEGFGIPSEALAGTERHVQIEYAAPEWRIYLASVEGRPAAMATLYVDGDMASIDGMTTVPQYRKRGCQTALLRRCIADAARAGCGLLASQTEPSSTSERNMVRCGFRVAYTKMLYSEREDL